jgi:hypothetical protein
MTATSCNSPGGYNCNESVAIITATSPVTLTEATVYAMVSVCECECVYMCVYMCVCVCIVCVCACVCVVGGG